MVDKNRRSRDKIGRMDGKKKKKIVYVTVGVGGKEGMEEIRG